MRRPLRVAACAIIALSACAAIWALLLMAGVKAFPPGSFLADANRLSREIHIILMLAGISGADAAAVVVVTRWQRPRLASLGLAIALCGAALLLLAIGADLLSTADLDSETYPQPMLWYPVVGLLLSATLGCFAIGWLLWLGATIASRPERRAALRWCVASPLRVCALLVLVAALAVTGWLMLGLPGVMRPADDYFQDTYYLVAAQRQLLPFAGVSAAIAAVVALAAGTPLAGRKLAATGLWMVVAGTAFLLGFVGVDSTRHMLWTGPMRVEAASARAIHMNLIGAAMGMIAMILLVLGVIFWVASRFMARRRGPA